MICTDVAGDGDGSSPETCLSLDVTDPEAWCRVVADIMRTHGRLDGALLAHGVQGPETPIDETPRDGWQHTLAINLDGCLHGLSAALPHDARTRLRTCHHPVLHSSTAKATRTRPPTPRRRPLSSPW